MWMKRRTGVLTLVIILLIGVCGCSMRKENKTDYEQEAIYEMRTHLKEKYGNISYEIKGFVAAGWDHEYDRLNLSAEIDGVDEAFYVKRFDNNGSYAYEDNYFGFVIREAFENKIREYADVYFSEYKVYAGMQSGNYPNSLTGKSSLNEMIQLKDEIGDITFIIAVDEIFENQDDFKVAAEAFVSEWEQIGLASTPRVIYLTHSIYETIERKNCEDILVNNRITEYSRVIK